MGGKVGPVQNGQPLTYDPSKKGPIKNRSCTDVLCCILFLAFVGGLVAVAFFAYTYGDPKLLLYPVDSNGQLCGLGSHRGKPNLFFFDLVKCGRMGPGVFLNGCPTPQVCMSTCPQKNYVAVADFTTNNKNSLICKDGTDKSAKTVLDLVKDDDCAAYYLKSETVLNRCLPLSDLLNLANNAVTVITDSGEQNLTDSSNSSISGAALNTAKRTTYNLTNETGMTAEDFQRGVSVLQQFLKAKEYGEKIISDIVATWWMMLVILILTMFVSLIWISVMRWIAGIMVWFTIIAFVGLFGFGTGYCFYEYYNSRNGEEAYNIYIAGSTFTFQKARLFLGLGITCGIIFVIVVLILMFLCQRIRIAIALIKEGSRAVGSMMFTLVFPLFPFIIQLVVIGFWAAVLVFLASIGRAQNVGENNVTFANGTVDEDAIKQQTKDLFQQVPCSTDTNDTLGSVCGYLKYGKGDYTIYLQVYNVFMMFWLVNFTIAFGQMTLAGAFSSYYWAFDKSKDIPTFPLLSAVWRCFRYHLGTLAFGSLIIAIVQLIRLMLEYVDQKLKGSENPVAKFFIKCMKCFFWCLEKFLKFINKNAYIMTAVYGRNFCMAAKDAFFLILRNIVRVVVIDKITDFLLFIGKLVVVFAMGTAAFFFFDGRIPYLNTYTPTLNFYLVPIVIVIIGSFVIVTCFFSVYEMAVDTIFLCFCEDLEKNDGSADKPYFMNKDLMKVLGKKNVIDKKDD
ncbi:choline transporter-like protein 2 isoform X3 [Gigantopelta aegis]|uniref:choline transporter-like protein 2 isoform X3 n=1 Tax=Gigantopelta aegis TaxID=1735272 RepID=UPI001B88D84E|nr:choline transporter-like protein 2 isoform X3 [Gigantopelta aegis]